MANNFYLSFKSGVMNALQAFREAIVTSEPILLQKTHEAFGEYESRMTRYSILWAFFESNVYRDIHTWAQTMKTKYSTYKYIRDIYNPTKKICTFHQTHIWGNYLDPDAGDGLIVPTGIPIQVDNNSVREAIAKLWSWSNWSHEKNILTLHGAVFGDAFMAAHVDPLTKQVYLYRVPPYHVEDIELSARGEVTYYKLTYMRNDPEDRTKPRVKYSEVAELNSNSGIVTYRTYREDKPYAWDTGKDEWTLASGFIPFVAIRHNDTGLRWGWSELQGSISKFIELDDMASKINDQIRKSVDATWLLAGVQPPRERDNRTEGNIVIRGPDGSPVSREETPIIYAKDPQAKPHPLVTDLSLTAALDNIAMLLGNIESDYPELQVAQLRAGGQDSSGRTLLVLRQAAEQKVLLRRAMYDKELIRLHRMAMAMAGVAGIDGFSGFDYDVYTSDGMEHRIPHRRVFAPTDAELAELEKAFWLNAHFAQRTGLDLEIYLRRHGWDEDAIQEVLDSEEYQARRTMVALSVVPTMGGGTDEDEGNPRLNEETGEVVEEGKAIVDPGRPTGDYTIE